jgi:hypothetical protein
VKDILRLNDKIRSIRSLVIIGIALVGFFALVFLSLNSEETPVRELDEVINNNEPVLYDKHARHAGEYSDRGNSYNIERIVADCGKDAHCAMEALSDMSVREHKETVLATFEGIISYYEENSLYCHAQAHHLSMFLYSYIGNISEALYHADETWCGGAVHHGLMETFFTLEKVIHKANPDDIDIKSICPTHPENQYALERRECLHGMGHGLMILYNHDVFKSVERCQEFELGWEQHHCANGIFMENLVYHGKTKQGTFDNEDLFYPCNAIDPNMASACYNYHASYIASRSGNTANAFKQCDKIVPEEFIKYCYRGMGRKVSLSVFDKIDRALNVCQSGKPEYHAYCFAGIAGVVVKHKSTDQAFEFCKSIPHQFKNECYVKVGNYIIMRYSTNEGRAEECSKAENSEYSQICMKGSDDDMALL